MRHYTISPQDEGLRLDQYLSAQKPDLTRSFIQKLIKEGNVFVNHKKIIKPAHPLKAGDTLMVTIPSIKEIGIQPENIPLDILYEDDDIAVINKPAGMVVHPTDHGAHVSGTLVNALLFHLKNLSGINGEKRPGIVHRLDKDTSGVMVVAKNDQAHQFLAKQFEQRNTQKTYLTLVKGHLTPKEGSIEAPLKRTFGKKDVQVSASHKAKYALTHYKVRQTIGDYSLIEVRIVTGRTHQIRVHFAAIGHPVAGDAMYGHEKTNKALRELGLKRQFLHAAELCFTLPNGQKACFSAELPPDLQEVLQRLQSVEGH